MGCESKLPGATKSKPVASIRLNSIHLSGSSCSAGGNRSQITYHRTSGNSGFSSCVWPYIANCFTSIHFTNLHM